MKQDLEITPLSKAGSPLPILLMETEADAKTFYARV